MVGALFILAVQLLKLRQAIRLLYALSMFRFGLAATSKPLSKHTTKVYL